MALPNENTANLEQFKQNLSLLSVFANAVAALRGGASHEIDTMEAKFAAIEAEISTFPRSQVVEYKKTFDHLLANVNGLLSFMTLEELPSFAVFLDALAGEGFTARFFLVSQSVIRIHQKLEVILDKSTVDQDSKEFQSFLEKISVEAEHGSLKKPSNSLRNSLGL